MSTPISSELIPLDIKLDGTQLNAFLQSNLLSARVERELRVAARATLRFIYPRGPEETDQQLKALLPKLGGEIQLLLGTTSLVTAEITSVSMQHDVTGSEVTVVAHDYAYRLFQGATYKTYSKVSYSDIVRTIAGANGLAAKVDSVSDQLDYLMQAESDGHLLDALADRAGYDWWVEAKELHFAKPADAAPVTLSLDEMLEFEVRASQQPFGKSVVVGRTPNKSTPYVQTVSAASAAVTASPSLLDTVKGPTAKSVQFGSETQAGSAEESQRLGQAMLDRAAASAVVARGRTFPDARIKPGIKLKVTDSGPTDGTYPVTAVEYLFRGGDGETRFRCGKRSPSSLVDTLTPRISPSFQHLGLVVGIVTNINDPNKLGRVKLKFPVLTGSGSEPESDWARVLMIGAGANRGSVFVPEVNDEVLVAFENADVRFPVVLGGLYGEKTKPPNADATVAGGKVAGRRITSREGNFVELGDGEAETAKHVLLQSKNGSTFRLGVDAVTMESKDQKGISIKAGQSSIELKPDGTITLQGVKIVVKGQSAVEVDGAQIKLAAQAALNAQASGQMSIKGGMTEVKADSILTLAGNAMVKIN